MGVQPYRNDGKEQNQDDGRFHEDGGGRFWMSRPGMPRPGPHRRVRPRATCSRATRLHRRPHPTQSAGTCRSLGDRAGGVPQSGGRPGSQLARAAIRADQDGRCVRHQGCLRCRWQQLPLTRRERTRCEGPAHHAIEVAVHRWAGRGTLILDVRIPRQRLGSRPCLDDRSAAPEQGLKPEQYRHQGARNTPAHYTS